MAENNSNAPQPQNNIDPTNQINWLSAMMSIDKEVNQKELRVILEYGLKLGLDETKIKRIVSTSLKGQDILLRYLKVSKLSRNDDLMKALIRVVFADGKIAKEELDFLKIVATKMNYTNDEIKAMFAEEKRNYLNNQQR